MPQPNGPVLVVLDKVDNYQTGLVAGVHAELEPRGVPVLVLVAGPQEDPPDLLIRLVRHRQVTGVLLTAASTLVAQQEWLALTDEPAAPPTVRIGLAGGIGVRCDNRQAMHQVAQHLVAECGARRVLVLRGPDHQDDSREREAGLRERLTALGVPPPDEFVVDGGFSRDQSFRAVRDALGRGIRFDAVAALNDRSAFGAIDALAAAGLRVPEDVVVTGFDDEDVAALARPSLTTVNQNLVEQGALAARLLLEVAAGHPVGSALVPVRLMRRGTTGTPVAPPTASQLAGPTERMQARIAAMDITLEISRAVLVAPTVETMVERFAAQLPQLGIGRAFVVLRTDDEHPRGVVVLVYRDGAAQDVIGERPFDLASLLPDHLAHHLTTQPGPAPGGGALVLHPLVSGETELGYLILEQDLGDRTLQTEALGVDLSRVLDGIRTTRLLTRHADELEALVAERTRQLKSEILTRRRTEAELRRANAELRESLHVDALTGIANRGALDAALVTQWSGHSRSRQPLSLVLIDVDHFRTYNERYGKARGDEALNTVSRCVQGATRRIGDLATRFGGDEFALLLPNTGPDGALVVATRLRDLVTRAGIEHEGCPAQKRLTVSIGVATSYPDALGDPEELVAAAEAALDDVKDAGRDGIASTRAVPRSVTESSAG